MIEIDDKDILPEELRTHFGSLDYEEEGGLSVCSIKYLENEVHFDFSLFMGKIDQNETQYWQMQIFDYRDSKIDLDNLGGYFQFYSDHFLLWEFIDRETELYFKKATNNPERLFAELYLVHNQIFNNYIPLEKFMNGIDLFNLCQAESGLFARGPKQILKHYFHKLQKFGNEPYYFGDYEPKKWNGAQWVSEEKDLKLALLGGTYFIGKDFKFHRINKK